MKKNLMVACLILVINVLSAQEIPQAQVPAVVLNAFQLKFPGITEIKWGLKEGVYKAQCEFQSREHDVWFNKEGVIKKHKQDFPKKELPQAIQQYIADNFKDYKIADADKIISDKGTFYQVEIEKKPEGRKLVFTDAGNLIENTLD